MIALAFLMLIPGTKFPKIDLFNFQDKAVHNILFSIQGYLWSGIGIDKNQVSSNNPKIWRNFILFGVLVGMGFEFLQQFIPYQSFELMDMIVNALDAGLGLSGYLKWPFLKYILD